MKVATVEGMNEMDSKSIEEWEIPSILLMEHAALAVMKKVLQKLEVQDKKNVLIFAGHGNNGGDGFALARLLHNQNVLVHIIFVGEKTKLAKDAEINYKMAQNLGISIKTLQSLSEQEMIHHIQSSSIIVDAIFGTGLIREIAGDLRSSIDLMNQYGKYIISIDIPSGIQGNTGKILGTAVKAQETITFALPKLGLYLYPGAEYAGKITIADIGIPQEVIRTQSLYQHVLTAEEFKRKVPPRPLRTHKGSYGKIQLIAGSRGMPGAAILSAQAAYRTGAGLVHLCVPQSILSILGNQVKEGISTPLDEKEGMISKKAWPKIQKVMKESDVVAIGPGLGQGEEVTEIAWKVIEEAEVPLVIDADGLNALSKNLSLLQQSQVPIILTPHIGEMSRLIQRPISYIISNPVEVVREFSARWNVITVLKDATSLIAHPNGEIYMNTTGNPGMATAGAGDVLTGIITSFIAQRCEPYEAAIMGTYLHGKAGDAAAKKAGLHGMMASDLCYWISQVLG